MSRITLVMLLAMLAATAPAQDIYWIEAGNGVNGEIYSDDYDLTATASIRSGGRPLNLALDSVAGKIYWTMGSYWLGASKIYRSNVDGTSEELIRDPSSTFEGPYDLAVDAGAGKLYFTQYYSSGFPSEVCRSDLDGTSFEELVSGLDRASAIALDLAGGKMYWSENRSTGLGLVKRSNLDGTGVEALISNTWDVYGIALDVAGGKMYYTEFQTDLIRRASLDGSVIEVLVSGLNAPAGITLDLASGKMFWAENGGFVKRANLDGTGVEVLAGPVINPSDIELVQGAAGPGCPITLCGDCDGDGFVNILDALRAAHTAAGLATLTPTEFSNCNVVGALEPDPAAMVSSLDALVIAQHVAGIASPTCCSGSGGPRPPECSIISPSGTIEAGDVSISYVARDASSDPVNITPMWSTDSGASWFNATERPGTPSEGVTGLSASPLGDNHTFVWNTVADGVGTAGLQAVQFRITVTNPSGSSICATSFNVNNVCQSRVCLEACWAGNFGGTGSERARSVATDPMGNIWIVGTHAGAADMDPSTGAALLPLGGHGGGFVVKLDAIGNHLWSGDIGAGASCTPTHVDVDAVTGDVWITGKIDAFPAPGGDMDPGAGTAYLLTQNSRRDPFVLKLDSSGGYLWAGAFENTFALGLEEAESHSITVDPASNRVWTVGRFDGTMDFDPGVGVSTRAAAPRVACFVSVLDTAGAFQWAATFDGGATQFVYEAAHDVDVDAAGNGWITGYFTGDPTDFDPGPGTALLSGDVGFVVSLDRNGIFNQAWNFPGTGLHHGGYGILAHSNGNIYVREMRANMVLACYQSNGTLEWENDYQGTTFVTLSTFGMGGITEEPTTGNVFFTGTYNGSPDMDTGPCEALLGSHNGFNPFWAKVTENGAYLGAGSAGSSNFGSSSASDIACNIDGAAWAVGTFDRNFEVTKHCGASLPLLESGDQVTPPCPQPCNSDDGYAVKVCSAIVNNPPSCAIILPGAGQSVSGIVGIDTDFSDPDGDPIDVTWFVDGGFGFAQCTPSGGSPNPATGLAPPGTATFNWDSVTDVAGTMPGVVLRARVSDGMLTSTCDVVVTVLNGGPLTGQLYVTNNTDATVSVIDRATMTGVTVINTNPSPLGLCILPNRSQVWVACTDAASQGTVQAIDTTTESLVQTVVVGTDARGIAAHPSSAFVYATCYEELWRVDTSTYATGTEPLSRTGGSRADPLGVTVLTDSSFVLDVCPLTDYIHRTVPDPYPPGDSRTNLSGGPGPTWIVPHPSLNSRVYISCNFTHQLLVWNPQSQSTVTTINLTGNDPEGLGVSPDGNWVYVCVTASDRIDVVDIATSTVATTILLDPGSAPADVIFSDDSAFAYVVERGPGRVTELRSDTHARTGRIAASGNDPYCIVLE